jgi:PKD repeat protein
MNKKILYISFALTALLCVASCASMGTPDGGEYDETPPKLVGSSPKENAIGSTRKKIVLNFDEFVKLENASEKVVVSPPQADQPEIKTNGKSISVTLFDTLKQNTTYTIDFADAIVDNNEGNPMGSYTFTFSTGTDIDTMEIAGTVLDASNLEPIKGLLVGLHSNLEDSAFTKLPFDRVSHTDSRGHFVIKGVKPGRYRVYALKDVDNNFLFNQKNEQIAFTKDIFETSCKPDIYNDTIWRDSTHVDSIREIPYTHFYPDNVVLRAFTEVQTQQYLIKTERDIPNRFSIYFSARSDTLPRLRGLNFNEKKAFILEHSLHNDTLTYWIRDTLVSNIDTLRMELRYLASDSTGKLVPRIDTLELSPKVTKEKLAKELKKQEEEWVKDQRKLLKEQDRKDDAIPPMPPTPLDFNTKGTGSSDPDKNVLFEFKEPLRSIDSTKIHLTATIDSVQKVIPYLFLPVDNRLREYCLYAEWKPGITYKLTTDSTAFYSIYGLTNKTFKADIKIQPLDAYSTLYMTVHLPDTAVVVQLMSSSDAVMGTSKANADGLAEFFFIKPSKYYIRCFVDRNGDGLWTTGNFSTNTPPEEVYYYPQPLELKAGWEVRQDWNVADTPVSKQKPLEITKQKPDSERKVKSRNAERAREKAKR